MPDLISPRDGGENRHGAFCFGHAAHAFRTWGVLNSSWGVLPPLMEVRLQLNEVGVNAAEGGTGKSATVLRYGQ